MFHTSPTRRDLSLMRTCSAFLLTLTAAWLATPADGASLYLSGYAQTEYGTVNAPPNSFPATATTAVTSSQTTTPGTDSNRNSSASYSAYMSLGDLGLSGGVSSFCNGITCGTETSGLLLDESATDQLTLAGVSSGVLAISFSVDGTFSGSSNNPQDFLYADYRIGIGVGANTTDTAIESMGGLGRFFSQNAGYANPGNTGSTMNFSFTQDPNNASLWDYVATGTATLPFTNGSLSLTSEIYTDGGCADGNGEFCAYSFDLLHTALIGDAVVYDSTGQVATGATITSSSGYDYTQPLQETNTPEPATFGLIGSALAALAMLRRKLT